MPPKCVCGHSLNDHEKPGRSHCYRCCTSKPVGECLHNYEEDGE